MPYFKKMAGTGYTSVIVTTISYAKALNEGKSIPSPGKIPPGIRW
jgi:hypothetical protein